MEIRDLVPLVQAHARLCPVPVIINSLRKAINIYLRKTKAWKEWLPPVDAVAGQARYMLPVFHDGVIDSIDSVVFIRDDHAWELEKSEESILPPWGGAVKGLPGKCFFGNDDMLELYPAPEENIAGAINVKASLYLDMKSTMFPRFLDEEKEIFANGAIADVLAMTAQPWAQPSIAAYRQEMFNKGVAAARIRQIKGNNRHGSEVTPRPFGG